MKIIKKLEHNWLIQIGAFLNKSDAYAQIIKASQIFPSGLSDSTISITPVKSDGNILFRARNEKITARDKAKKACYILEKLMGFHVMQLICLGVEKN